MCLTMSSNSSSHLYLYPPLSEVVLRLAHKEIIRLLEEMKDHNVDK